MTTTIIGYGPIQETPCIPDSLILQTDENIVKIEHNQNKIILIPKKLDDLVATKQIILFDTNIEYHPDQWIAVECNTPLVVAKFSLADTQKWAAERALKLIQESTIISQREPLKVISILQTAASLCKIDLNKLVQALESKRNDASENLADILLRVKSGLNN